MELIETPTEKGGYALRFDLGTFEGFNFRENSAIDRGLTGDEVVNWDHDAHGEAEFWPSGDNAGVSLVFRGKSSVTGRELLDLDRVLDDVGDDSEMTFLRIHHAVHVMGTLWSDLTGEQVEDQFLHIYTGTSFYDLRREAAFELFEMRWPEVYRIWERTYVDGLVFDPDQFLDSPIWSVEEIELTNGTKALIVGPQ